MSTGTGIVRPRFLAASSPVTAAGVKASARDAVDGVGGQQHQLAPADRRRGGVETGGAGVGVGAVVEVSHGCRSLPHACSDGAAGGGEPRPAGEVGVVLDVGEGAVRADQRGQRGPLLVGVLDAEPAAGMQQPRGDGAASLGRRRARRGRPTAPAAGRGRPPRAAARRRPARRAGWRRRRRRVRRARTAAPGRSCRPGRRRRACRPRTPGPAALWRVHSIAPGSRSTAVTRAPGCSCAIDSAMAPGSAAQVDDDRPVGPAEPLERPAGELLGLRPGHEDAGADRQLEEAERRPAGEVLQRHAVGPLVDQRAEPDGDVVRDVDQGEQPAAGDARGRRRAAARRPPAATRRRPRPAGGRRRRAGTRSVQEPAASSSAVCASVRASIPRRGRRRRTWSRL